MARKRREKVKESEVTGTKYLRTLLPLLERPHDERGIEIQTSCAIIACTLISLWTGRKPVLRTGTV